jgi:hypothetical protein
MARLDLRRFPQVWVVGVKCRQPAGERPEVHCLAAQEMWSGESLCLWREDLARLHRPPYPVGPGSLLVYYDAVAGLACHLALGWQPPCRVVDLQVEFRWRTNGTGWREGEERRHGLTHAADYFGLDPTEAAERPSARALAARGEPFTPDERRALLACCEREVSVTAGLLECMAPCLTLQALQRGRFARTAARMLHAGIPLDVDTLRRFRAHREGVARALMAEVDPAFGVFEGTEFKPERMEALVRRHGLRWPRLDPAA